MKRVVILGGGSGGAVAAKRLGRWSQEGEFEVVLIDRSRWHEYRPSYLWVMTGKREPDQVRRELSILSKRYGTRVVNAEVTAIDPEPAGSRPTRRRLRLRLPDRLARRRAAPLRAAGRPRGALGAG